MNGNRDAKYGEKEGSRKRRAAALFCAVLFCLSAFPSLAENTNAGTASAESTNAGTASAETANAGTTSAETANVSATNSAGSNPTWDLEDNRISFYEVPELVEHYSSIAEMEKDILSESTKGIHGVKDAVKEQRKDILDALSENINALKDERDSTEDKTVKEALTKEISKLEKVKNSKRILPGLDSSLVEANAALTELSKTDKEMTKAEKKAEKAVRSQFVTGKAVLSDAMQNLLFSYAQTENTENLLEKRVSLMNRSLEKVKKEMERLRYDEEKYRLKPWLAHEYLSKHYHRSHSGFSERFLKRSKSGNGLSGGSGTKWRVRGNSSGKREEYYRLDREEAKAGGKSGEYSEQLKSAMGKYRDKVSFLKAGGKHCDACQFKEGKSAPYAGEGTHRKSGCGRNGAGCPFLREQL